MTKFPHWISANYRDLQLANPGLECEELAIILQETTSHRIGITACGVFTISYGMVTEV